MQQAVVDLLAKKRDRALAITLGLKEREIDQYLPLEARNKLRKVILDQINEFHDTCIELMRSFDDDDTVINQIWLDRLDHRLDEMYDVIVGNGNGKNHA